MVKLWRKYDESGRGKLQNKINDTAMPVAELNVLQSERERERERERETAQCH
jgi:hypothetical protein